MRIEVYGQPQGKQRARVCVRGNFARAYTPEKTASYENLINLSYIQALKGAPSPYWDKPVRISILAIYQIPKSFSKKRTAEALDGLIRPQVKPDIDNVIKVVCDALNKVAYDDLLNKFQTSYYDTYAEEIAANFAAVNTDTVDKSLQRGEITQAQYDDIKSKYNASVASAITSATLFYDSGVKLDEKNAKALAEKIKNSGWLSDENKSKIDTFLADDYKEEDDGGGCYAKGTLITVADGSLVPVEELKEGDNILVFNHYTGEVDIAPVLYMYYEGKKEYDVLKLHFGEAADIEVLYGHGFFDVDLNKYVLISTGVGVYIFQ